VSLTVKSLLCQKSPTFSLKSPLLRQDFILTIKTDSEDSVFRIKEPLIMPKKPSVIPKEPYILFKEPSIMLRL